MGKQEGWRKGREERDWYTLGSQSKKKCPAGRTGSHLSLRRFQDVEENANHRGDWRWVSFFSIFRKKIQAGVVLVLGGKKG